MKLGNIISLVRGNTYKSALLSETEGPVLLGLGSIQRNGGFKCGTWKRYPGNSDSRILLHPGDLYVSLKDLTQSCDLLGAVARVPLDMSEGRLTQDTVKLEFNPGLDAKTKLYTYWSLRTPQYRAYCKARGTGTTNMSLSRNDFLGWDIPAQSEARDVLVNLFELIELKIEANIRLNGYLAELQQAIYADSTKEGAQTTIGEIAEVIDCLHSKKPQRQPSGKPLIQLNNIIDDGILNMTDTFYISEDDYAKWISRCEVKPGDCVITNVGRIGAVSQVPQGTTAAMGRNMTCIRPGAYAATVITALCSNAMRYEIEKRTDAGTIMNALNVRNIPKLELYLPPAEVRDSVETTLKTIQDARELLLKERQEFAALRDVLLPKLMSGEIDVSKINLTQLNSHLA